MAATSCISDVPGLAKQTSTPHSFSVWIKASAPFMLGILLQWSARHLARRVRLAG